MKCSKYIKKRCDIKKMGLILLAIGVAALLILFLPYSVWIAILGLIMIFFGYKLFAGW